MKLKDLSFCNKAEIAEKITATSVIDDINARSIVIAAILDEHDEDAARDMVLSNLEEINLCQNVK